MKLWRWRYGIIRLRVDALSIHRDVEVTIQTGPTRWGPWGKPSPQEEERLRAFAKLLAHDVLRFAHYGGYGEALVQLLPSGEVRKP